MTEEDEAFNEIERQAKQRKESVMAAVHTLTEYQRGYENGFIDGMQKQMQSSVDKAVNAMSQTQEPFCFFYVENGEEYFAPKGAYVPDNAQPLYTAPPQRTWVGLTDKEIDQGYETTGHYQTLRPQDKFAVYALARAIEAKLKEKNT
jgi:hypothetical protein